MMKLRRVKVPAFSKGSKVKFVANGKEGLGQVTVTLMEKGLLIKDNVYTIRDSYIDEGDDLGDVFLSIEEDKDRRFMHARAFVAV